MAACARFKAQLPLAVLRLAAVRAACPCSCARLQARLLRNRNGEQTVRWRADLTRSGSIQFPFRPFAAIKAEAGNKVAARD